MTRLIQRTYSLARVFSTRDRLVKDASRLFGQSLTVELYHELLDYVQRRLQPELPWNLLNESLLHLAGQTLSRSQWFTEAWRLAGNLDRLRRFHAVPPWNRQFADEYVPVQVTSVFNQYRDKRTFVEFSLRVLAGTPATLLLKKSWSLKFCSMLSSSLGFSRPWEELRFDDPRQFVGLRFYALIEQKLCGTLPRFEKLWVDETNRIKPAGCYTQNRQLLKLRQREHSHYPCPGKLKPDVPCHICIYGLDRCPLAVHAQTFKKQKCHHCLRESWFDPQLSSQRCIQCCDLQEKGEL